jgi:DNA-binding response OmpR family regulator
VLRSVLLVCREDLRAQELVGVMRDEGITIARVQALEEVEDAIGTLPDLGVILCDWPHPEDVAYWIVQWRALAADTSPDIVFLTDSLPPQSTTKDLFDAGAADLWLRPLPDYYLVPRLKVRLRPRPPVLPPQPESPPPDLMDIVTLLPGGRLFLDQAEGLFSGAGRLGLFVGVLAMSIAKFDEATAGLTPKERNEILQFLADQLRQCKRKEDLLARWSDKVFLLASYFPRGERVELFGRRILDALQSKRYPHAQHTGALRFTVAGAWGPSPDYPHAADAVEEIVYQVNLPEA